MRLNMHAWPTLQVKSFEADVVEAQPYQSSIAAASELRAMLDGSKTVGTRKGVSAQDAAPFTTLPQVRASGPLV
jgi:histidine ammonia-lyase